MFWFAVAQNTKDRLGREPQLSIGRWLGPSDGTRRQMKEKCERLKTVGNAVISDPKFVARDGLTFCNFALWEVAAEMGYEEFKAKQMTANQIVRHMESSREWRVIESGEEASELAKRGDLVVAGRKYPKHGHVAAVAPVERMLFSGSLNKYVPLVYNVGKKNGLMKVSECFPPAEGEPTYFALT